MPGEHDSGDQEKLEQSSENISTDKISNKCWFLYLENIIPKLPQFIDQYDVVIKLKSQFDKPNTYDSNYAYGDLYNEFILFIEELVTRLKSNQGKGKSRNLEQLDDIILAIYKNENASLEYVGDLIEPMVRDLHQTSREVEDIIFAKLNPNGTEINYYNATFEGSLAGRLIASTAGVFQSPNYNPLAKTNIPSIRRYEYQEHLDLAIKGIKEHRMGTQGQYYKGHARVNPIFERFLEIQAKKNQERETPKEITHVYINNLSTSNRNYESRWENTLSDELHNLEDRHSNIAVISLPTSLKSSTDKTLDEFRGQITQWISQNQYGYRFSDNIRQKLFGEPEASKINDLFYDALQDLNYQNKSSLTKEEQQALYFHFNKFTLTHHILTTLDPDGFGITCKDAIDRAAVASAYYNLVLSIKSGNPMSEPEFYRALHAAAVMVKGRGINKHSKKFYITVSAFVEANKEKYDIPKWLFAWLDVNHPDSSTKKRLLSQLQLECRDSDLQSLVNLYDKIKDVTNPKHPYRELAHQKNLIDRSYCNEAYGYTESIRQALDMIKESILQLLATNSNVLSDDDHLKNKLRVVLEDHTNPWTLACWGQTKEQNDPRASVLYPEVKKERTTFMNLFYQAGENQRCGKIKQGQSLDDSSIMI